MLTEQLYPILEYDDDPVGKLDPANLVKYFTDELNADKLVITFFPEVMKTLIEAGEIELARVIPGENPVEIYRFLDQPDTLVTLGQVGCPACGGNLDLIQAMGVDKVMFCGGGGVLDRGIDVGRLLVVDGAIRDEGFSYHYLPPARVVEADCPTQDCVHTGTVTYSGQSIVCLPARIVIRLEGGAAPADVPDAVLG